MDSTANHSILNTTTGDFFSQVFIHPVNLGLILVHAFFLQTLGVFLLSLEISYLRSKDTLQYHLLANGLHSYIWGTTVASVYTVFRYIVGPFTEETAVCLSLLSQFLEVFTLLYLNEYFAVKLLYGYIWKSLGELVKHPSLFKSWEISDVSIILLSIFPIQVT